MLVLGLDLGTKCGCADGQPNGKPRSWTIGLDTEAGHGRPARFALWQKWLEGYLAHLAKHGHQPGELKVFYEQPPSLGKLISMAQSPRGTETNDNAVSIARGLAGVLEATMFNAGVRHIEPIDVKAARKHMTKNYQAKKEDVFQHCCTLGWTPENHEESDAMAIWAMGCSLVNPRTAHLSTPLFSR